MSSRTDWLRDAPLAELSPGSAGDSALRPFLWRLMRGEDMSQAEAAALVRALLDKEKVSGEQIAAALVALAAKGETAAELAGMAEAMRDLAQKFETRARKFIDISGTGSSRAKTFNVSTAAAFIVAGAGLAVAKQSSRRVTSQTGSAEALEALGVRLNYPKEAGGEARSRERATTAFNGAGLCFLSPAAFHGELNFIANVRRKLGVRTTFNLLGALSNPARPPFQLVGVWHRSLLVPMAEALNLLGAKRAWVVHGADGSDEITIEKETFVAEALAGKISTFTVEPEDFGVQRGSLARLRAVDSPEASAKIINDILAGKRRDEARSLAVINAAAALFIGGTAKNEMQAARLAEQSIDSDSARIKLERLVMTTNK